MRALLKQIDKYKVTRWDGFFKRYKSLFINTLVLERESIKFWKPKDIPNSYKLCDLYKYLRGDNLWNMNHASVDVSAEGTILREFLF